MPDSDKTTTVNDKKVHGYLLGYGGGGLAGIMSFLYMWGTDIKDKLGQMQVKQEKVIELYQATNTKLDKIIDLKAEENKRLEELVKAAYRKK